MTDDLNTKVCYVGAPAIFKLNMACHMITLAFPKSYGCYLVGSSIVRPDFRDVDVRCLMKDEDFWEVFPDVYSLDSPHWELDPRWLLMTSAISMHLADVTGLNIDFQFQPANFANRKHKGVRHPLGSLILTGRDDGK